MTNKSFLRCFFFCTPLLLVPQQANAWFFFFIPGGLFSRDVDPDSIEVAYLDRIVGKCAGYHINQASGQSKSEEEKNFHSAMADKVLERANDKDKTKEVAEAYSAKWGKAAQVDLKSNRAYGADLANGCRGNGIPLTLAQQQAEKLQEEASKQQEAQRQEEARRQEETKRQEEARRQEEEKRIAAEQVPVSNLVAQTPASVIIDFNSEARKSARILGCVTSDLKVVGAEEKNVMFLASCEGGALLNLSCDPTGLCLKK